MLFSYDYGWWQSQRWHQNTPPLQPILKALWMHQSNTDSIAQCGMSRATLEATGRRHWATTHSVLPQWPPGQQQTKQWWENGPTLLAILMAAAVRRYNTAHIPQWRRSRASLEATGCCNWASIAADSIKRTWLRLFYVFHCQNIEKCHGLSQRPLFSIGLWHIKWKRRA